MSFAVVTLVAAALSSCHRQPSTSTTESPTAKPAPPALVSTVRTPVGPVPGPVDEIARPNNPFADAMSRQAGRRLFNQFNCSGCHGDHAGGGMGPSLRDAVWRYGAADAQVFMSISDGRSQGMPAWGAALTDEQIWKIVTYIKSMRTPDEPEPPQ